MHHTVKKDSKKGIKKKEKKKQGYEKFFSRDSNPDPQNQLQPKINASARWTTSVDAEDWSLKEVYIPSICSLRKEPTAMPPLVSPEMTS